MPKFNKRRKFIKRRKFRSRRKFRKAGHMVPTKIRGLPSAFPASSLLKLRYQMTTNMNGAVGIDQIMNLNSLFDPDRSGVGHQPYAYDQWSLIYNRWRVYGCKYKVTFVNIGSSVPRVGIMPSNDANTMALSTTVFEQPTTKSALLGELGSGGVKKVFYGYVPLTRIYGVTKVQLRCDDRYAGDASASPAELAVLHCVCQDSTLSTNPTVLMEVNLVYYCQFYDWNSLAQS